ncbi:zinc-binding dehydrogenase [Leucobacter sp. NPDC058333]|uniref:zinc-binding dehydrogenase n=1 Tax=Leucobacter sp. NPDC058333 TaxID=3346450 RepID=UPI00364F0E75
MVFLGGGLGHEAREVAHVELGNADVLVRVELATVCGSDVHTVLGHRDEPVPLVLGHEAVARVVRVGEAARYVDGTPVALGDRVVWSISVHCSACDRCERGLTQKCRTLRKYGHTRFGAPASGTSAWQLSGGFATHVHLLAGTSLLRVAEDVPAAVLAPAGCGIATAHAALAAASRTVPLGVDVGAPGGRSFSGVSGISVLVTGAGLIGLAVTAMATERGAAVTVSDPDPDRRAWARRFGAAHVVDPLAHAGETADSSDPGEYDVVIDASGSPAAVAAGLDAVAVGGAVVWVGSVFPADAVPVVPERVVRGLVTITGVHNYVASDLAGAVEFLTRNWREYPFAELVGAEFDLAQIDAAVARAAEHREVRVGVRPGSMPHPR